MTQVVEHQPSKHKILSSVQTPVLEREREREKFNKSVVY
jgi:hypothetical protein